MDFVVSLPSTDDGYDCIFVVVDRLSKMAHLIPTRSTASAADTARLFFVNIFRLHGLPSEIITDRDSKFTSDFWRQLFQILQTSLRFSTAYHQQTDGQTERVIRVINQLIRCCATRYQTHWVDQLPAIEFAYNSSISSSTTYSPFFLCNGYSPKTPAALLHSSVSVTAAPPPLVADFVETTRATLHHALDCLHKAQESQRAYADLRRRDVQFETGIVFSCLPFILFLTTSRQQSENFSRLSLDHTRSLKNLVVSIIVYFFLLRSKPSSSFKVGSDDFYHVDRVLGHRRRYGRDFYLVSWQGYSAAHNSWEPASNLTPDLIQAYHAHSS